MTSAFYLELEKRLFWKLWRKIQVVFTTWGCLVILQLCDKSHKKYWHQIFKMQIIHSTKSYWGKTTNENWFPSTSTFTCNYYQCYIWKLAFNPILELPDPVGGGWKKNSRNLKQGKWFKMLYQKPQLSYYTANARKSSKQMLAVVER